MLISRFDLAAIMPLAGARIDEFVLPLHGAMDEYDITTPERAAAFIAQIAHESGQLRYVAEIWGPTRLQAGYDQRADLGNTRDEAVRIATAHGSTPGRWWKGHGLIQVTGYDNHLSCGKALGLDLLNNPKQLEEPYAATRSAAWFWNSRKLNGLADQGEFRAITKKINGGLNGIQDREAYYNRAKKALGVE